MQRSTPTPPPASSVPRHGLQQGAEPWWAGPGPHRAAEKSETPRPTCNCAFLRPLTLELWAQVDDCTYVCLTSNQ